VERRENRGKKRWSSVRGEVPAEERLKRRGDRDYRERPKTKWRKDMSDKSEKKQKQEPKINAHRPRTTRGKKYQTVRIFGFREEPRRDARERVGKRLKG